MELAAHDANWKPPRNVLITMVAPNEGSSSSPLEDVQLSLPQEFSCSREGQQLVFIGTPQREEYWYRSNGTPMSEYGQLIVDGAPCVDQSLFSTWGTLAASDRGWGVLRSFCRSDLGVRMSDTENWVSCYRGDNPYRTGEVELRKIVYVTYTLLATSFICRVRPWTGIGPHSPSAEPIPVDLVRANLRTRHFILDELRAHIEHGEGKYIGRLVFCPASRLLISLTMIAT